MKWPLVICLTLIALFPLGGCGQSGAQESTRGPSSKPATNEAEQAFAGNWAGLKKVAGRHAGRLIIPRGPVPDEVVIRDLKVGSGPPIKPGEVFYSRYISFDYEDGKASEPYWEDSAGGLAWGTGERVKGWEPGLKGIRQGGIRELIVPASLAYGNSALVYVIAIDKIERD
jgi:peptidylprolyl isomerase